MKSPALISVTKWLYVAHSHLPACTERWTRSMWESWGVWATHVQDETFQFLPGQNKLISTLGTFLGMNAAGQTWSSTLCQSDRRMNSHKTWESHQQTFGNGGREDKCCFTYAEHRLLANHFCSRSAWSCSWMETGTRGLLGPFSSCCPSWAHMHIHCLN